MSDRDPNRPSLEEIRERELEEARIIQQSMVPTEPLKDHLIELACKFRPVAGVGGDFLDYFRLGPQRVGLYIGDVAGKGLPAAFYAALVAGTLRGCHKTGTAPSDLLELLNHRLLMRGVPGRCAAVQYAVFDLSSSEVQYATAGLPAPLLATATGCQQLDGTGFPSAMFEDVSYDQYRARLAPGDAILFLTDGLTEALNCKEEPFGIERLTEACRNNRSKSAESILDSIFGAVDAFTKGAQQHDDMTAAVLKLA